MNARTLIISGGVLYGIYASMKKSGSLDGLGRVGYVPKGGRAVAARSRANQSRASGAQRNVYTAQRMSPGQQSEWSQTMAARTQKPGREMPMWTPPSSRLPAPATPTQPTVNTSPAPKSPGPKTPGPKTPAPKSPGPKTPAPNTRRDTPAPSDSPRGPAENSSSAWFEQMRRDVLTNTGTRPATPSPIVTQKKTSKFNPLIAAGVAALIPIFGAMA